MNRFHTNEVNRADVAVLHRLANKLSLKVAELAALEADYYKSISMFEKVGKSSVSNNLMKCKHLRPLRGGPSQIDNIIRERQGLFSQSRNVSLMITLPPNCL